MKLYVAKSTTPFMLMIRPSAIESFKGILQYLATREHTIIFDAKGTTMSTMDTMILDLFIASADRLVLRVTRVMNVGKSTPEEKVSSLSTKADPKGGPSGIANPTMKGPNSTPTSR